MGTMSPTPVMEAAQSLSRGLTGVDREQKKLLGYIVAERGPLKSKRGEFATDGLKKIVEMGNSKPIGLKSRFTHPGLSSDALGTHLGRVTNFRMDGDSIVRADLSFSDVAFKGPKGDLATYVMDLAESDPQAIMSSLVLVPKQEMRLNPDGTRMKGPDGSPLLPLWTPEKLFASDIVDEGDATNSLLSAGIDIEQLQDGHLRQVWEILNSTFAGQDRLTVQTRVQAFLSRYLDDRFGPTPQPERKLKILARRLRMFELNNLS